MQTDLIKSSPVPSAIKHTNGHYHYLHLQPHLCYIIQSPHPAIPQTISHNTRHACPHPRGIMPPPSSHDPHTRSGNKAQNTLNRFFFSFSFPTTSPFVLERLTSQEPLKTKPSPTPKHLSKKFPQRKVGTFRFFGASLREAGRNDETHTHSFMANPSCQRL